MKYTLDEFKNVWNGISANDILNQFYYEHIELQKALERIANLQQENERMEKEWKSKLDDVSMLTSRINKAIELLELKQLRYLNEDDYRICTLDLQEVKDILQNGSEKNEQSKKDKTYSSR